MRIYIAGDSTAATAFPDVRPRAGWGEFLGAHFLPEVEIRNFATDNESSKLFINDNLLSAIKYEIQAGDFLLIQFGHNDQVPDEEKETTPFGSYQFYLQKYIDAAREVGATPILLTPVSRGEFLDDGTVEQTLGNYPDACRQLGEKVGVAVLDLNVMTAHYLCIFQLGFIRTIQMARLITLTPITMVLARSQNLWPRLSKKAIPTSKNICVKQLVTRKKLEREVPRTSRFKNNNWKKGEFQ